MTKHTPGPWETYDDRDETHIAIKGFFGKTGGAHVAEVLGRANANLIAAAPDMLKALRAISNTNNYLRDGIDCTPDLMRKIARDAIAKAEP